MSAADFLTAIFANPDDDAPRLIYADWLDEQGDSARAEFIRVQCALAVSKNFEQRATMTRRQSELFEGNSARWNQPELGVASERTYQRGFVEKLRISAPHFVAYAQQLFAHDPIDSVSLYWGADPPHERAQFMATVAGMPELSRLVSLDITDGYIGSSGVRALGASEHCTKLRELRLAGNHIGEAGIYAILTARWFTHLQVLDLRRNDLKATSIRILTDIVEDLDQRGDLQLRVLILSDRPLSATAQRLVRRSPVLRRLRVL